MVAAVETERCIVGVARARRVSAPSTCASSSLSKFEVICSFDVCPPFALLSVATLRTAAHSCSAKAIVRRCYGPFWFCVVTLTTPLAWSAAPQRHEEALAALALVSEHLSADQRDNIFKAGSWVRQLREELLVCNFSALQVRVESRRTVYVATRLSQEDATDIHRALGALGHVRLLAGVDFTAKATADASLRRQRAAQQDALTNMNTDLVASLVQLRGAGVSAKAQRRDARLGTADGYSHITLRK